MLIQIFVYIISIASLKIFHEKKKEKNQRLSELLCFNEIK